MPFKGPQPLRRVRCFGTTEIQGHCQVISLGTEVQGHHKEQLTQTLTCVFVENALVFVAPKIGKAQAPLAPPAPPDWVQQSRVDVEKLQH